MSKVKKQQKAEQTALDFEKGMLGENLNFAASEAYKLLRVNLLFSLPDEKRCHVIGVTSSVRSEGKSTTAVNLAYTFAETGNRVLLIEGDLRLPNLAKRLGLRSTPGLSNLLANVETGGEVLQKSPYFENWTVITAGDIPPNPSELLGSSRMRVALTTFATKYDYIIIDLPPVNIVSDALVVSTMADGMILVCREDYSTMSEVKEAVHKFEISDAKILGFVMTHAKEKATGYRYKKYGKYGGKKYYKKAYGYGSYSDNRYGYYSYGYGYGRPKTTSDEGKNGSSR